MARPRTRSIVTLLIAIAAVIAALTLIGDVREVRARLDGFAWITFAAALGLALGNYALRFVRWHGYLRTRQLAVPVGQSALVFVAGFSMAVTSEFIEDFCEMAGIEFVLIGKNTTIPDIKKELRWNEVYYGLAKGF